MKSNEKVISEALSLPPETRALLADKLLNSLDSSNRQDLDKLWAVEAERRVQQIKNGEVEAIPGEKVFRDIRKSLSS
ncbi:MAG: addiction module protein [bacterium]|nr:addiction module protein [bacterium]